LDGAELLLYNFPINETGHVTPLAAPTSIASVHAAHADGHHHGHGGGHDHAAHDHGHVHDHAPAHRHEPLGPRPAADPGLRVLSALTLSATGRLMAAGAMAATLWLLVLWAMS